MAEFQKFQLAFEAESALRENIRNVVRDLEGKTRTITAILSQAHLREANVSILCADARSHFPAVRAELNRLKELVSAERFYRYNDMWRFTIQQLCFSVAFLVFLESSRCVTTAETQELLGVQAEDLTVFHFDIEDFLHGLCSLTGELARLAVNSVIAENFKRPLIISAFVAELYEGFQLLNLKNDSLRKRFDAIKYDAKKIEEVVYDISIRGLTKPPVESMQT